MGLLGIALVENGKVVKGWFGLDFRTEKYQIYDSNQALPLKKFGHIIFSVLKLNK
jgi:hypothetical protein